MLLTEISLAFSIGAKLSLFSLFYEWVTEVIMTKTGSERSYPQQTNKVKIVTTVAEKEIKFGQVFKYTVITTFLAPVFFFQFVFFSELNQI